MGASANRDGLTQRAGGLSRGCSLGQSVAVGTLSEAGCWMQGRSSFLVAIATVRDVVVTAGIPGPIGVEETWERVWYQGQAMN